MRLSAAIALLAPLAFGWTDWLAERHRLCRAHLAVLLLRIEDAATAKREGLDSSDVPAFGLV